MTTPKAKPLRECECVAGSLLSVQADQDDEMTLSVSFSELPELRGEYEVHDLDLSEVQSLVGRSVWLAKILGKYRIGAMSSYFTGGRTTSHEHPLYQ